MLILSRKIGEAIQIGDDIRIVFLGYRNAAGEKVRIEAVEASIGIEAPITVAIMRTELLREKEGGPDCTG